MKIESITPIVCSGCFKNYGLRLEAEKIGFIQKIFVHYVVLRSIKNLIIFCWRNLRLVSSLEERSIRWNMVQPH